MQVATDPVDVQDLQFKLQCRLKIFDKTEGDPIKNAANLVAAASRFGLIFVGCNSTKLKVVRFASIEDYSSTDSVGNYSRREFTLPTVPEHLSVNCDHTKLAVIISKDKCPVVLFYDVKSFVSQNVQLLNEVRLSTTPNVKVLGANWHPTIDSIFTECKTDGSLGVYELKGNSVDINKLPAEANATCFCWSPKGKQIAVGSADGKLTHYKPDLKAVKVINAPPFEKPYSIISLQWISNYQFIGVFKPLDASDDQCCLVLIDAPKAGNPKFTNFYDVCYSNGNYRAPQFYLLFEQHWNIVIVGSANSMEIGVLAGTEETWTQWTLPDTARAELPLDENREETYPIGIAIDNSSVKPIPWGESSLQPAPSLLLLSHQGVLCSFKIINLKAGIPSINSPPDSIADLSGLGAFTTGTIPKPVGIPKLEPQVLIQPTQQPTIQTQVQKEASPSLNFTPQKTGAPQFSFMSSQITIQPVLKPQSQPPATTPPANIFGGQVTITPLGNKGTTPNSTLGSLGSLLLNAGNTQSTSVSSAAPIIPSKPVQQFSVSPIAQSQLPPSNVVVPTEKTSTEPEIVSVESEPRENNEEIDKILVEMIQMECAAVENELQVVLFQGKQLQTSVSPEIIDKIHKGTKDIEDFIKELVETSESQNSEIHILKQNMIQTWAWFEEAKTRFKDLQNEELRELWKSRPLDSVSEKHLASLKQMEYYLDSQLNQAHRALDEQWDDFQNFCRKVTRLPMPTMETIFQTLVKQNVILERQEFLLKDIKCRVKTKKKKAEQDLLNSLNESDLNSSMKSMTLDADNIHRIYQTRIMNKIKPLSIEHSNRLRKILEGRSVRHVTVNSQIGASILQTPPQRKTPLNIRKTEAAKTLNFYQSTPIDMKSAYTTQIPSTPLSAFAPTCQAQIVGNVQGSSKVNTENLTRSSFSSVAPSVAAAQTTNTSMSNMQSVSNNEQKTTTQSAFGTLAMFAKQTAVPSSSSLFSTQIPQNNAFVASKPSNIASSGTFTTLKPTISTGNIFSNNSFAISGNTADKSLDLSVKPVENQTPSIFAKVTVSTSPAASITTPATSKVSFFTPITSVQITPTTQQSLISSSSSIKSSAFTPITTTISPFIASIPLTTTASTISFGKPLTVSSSASSMTPPVTKTITPTASTLILTEPTKPLQSGTEPAKFSFMPGTQNTSQSFGVSSTTNTTSTITTSSSTFGINSTSSNSNTAKTTASVFSSLPTSSTTADSSSIFKTRSSNMPVSSESVSTPTTTASIFNPVASTGSSSSIFASSTAVSNSNTSGSIFSAQAPSTPGSGSLFGKVTVATTSSSSLFGNTTATTSASGSSFGTTASTATTSLFGTAVTTASIFGTAATTTATSSSLFGKPATTAAASLFGTTAATTTTSSSLFGAATATTTTSSSLFGAPTATTTTSSSLFGSSAATTSTSSSLFGTTAPITSTSSSLFGTSAATTGSIFGTGALTATTTSSFSATPPTCNSGSFFGTTATSSASIFGTASPATSGSNSLFGTSGQTSGSGSLFGAAAPTATSPAPIFGATTASTTQSGFGVSSTSNLPMFGTPTTSTPFATPPSTSSNSIFGNPTSSSAPFGGATSAFGSVSSASSPFATTTSSSAFGASSFGGSPFGTTGTAAPPFGAAATSPVSPFGATSSAVESPFGAAPNASPFGKPAGSPFSSPNTSTSPFVKPSTFGQSSSFGSGFGSAPTTSSSMFGQPTAGSSIFGSNTSSGFGGTTTSSSFGGSAFGATPSAAASPFGQTTSSGGLFGSSQSSVFGATSNTDNASFGFGSLNVGAAAQNPFTKATETKSPFGPSTFSSSSSSGSLFGSTFGGTSGGSAFGQSSFGNTFGNAQQSQTGPFSGGAGSVSQSGFGAAPAFQKQSGFGAQPSFGGSPAFGSSPTFGGSPSFGSTSPFGSPQSDNKTFGSANTANVFGTNAQQAPAFGNMANQNTVGFGNLAQTNASGQSSGFSGASSFSSWR